MSGSCPVCYESFIESQPRRLNLCGDIICSNCIQAELGADDNMYYCPECGTPHTGSLLGEISSEVSPELIISTISLSNDEDSGTNTRESDSAILLSNSGCSSNSASENEADLPDNGQLSEKKTISSSSVPRKPCSISGCKYKAIHPHKYCLKHSHKRRKSIVEVEMIAQDMLNNHDLRYFSVGRAGKKITHMDHTDKSLSNSTAPHVLLAKFKAQQRIELGEALDLILRAKAILSREPNILKLDAPVVVVGDIHGQFFDLLKIFDLITEPKESKLFSSDASNFGDTNNSNGSTSGETDKIKGKVFLFLGDYVDRGYYSCEVMLYLLSLKLQYPQNIWLLRGNHECASVSGHFGFKEECKTKYGVNIYYSFLLLFQTMPLAAVISTSFGKMYACHGGLSPSLETLESIESIDRLVEPEQNADLMDIVWSDPISDEGIEHMSQQEYESFLNIEWRPNPARGCSYFYGYKAVKSFLRRNDLVCLVRAHEVQEEGYRKHFDPEIMEKKVRSLNKKLEKANTLDADSKAGRLSEGSVGGGGGDEDSQSSSAGSKEDNNGSATKNSLVIQISTPSSSAKAHLSQNLTPLKYDDSKWDLKTHPTDNFPPVITIFSAPNYCSRYQNKGAILFIDQSMSNCRFQLYDCVDHPTPHVVESQNSNLIQAILATCPYMPTSFRNFVRLAVELGYDDYLCSSADSNPEDVPAPAAASSALSYSSDCSDSNLLQGEALANSNNMRMSSGSVGTFELARAQDAVGLHDIVASIPSLNQKGSTISENSLSVAGTKRDSPKTISLFRIFPTVDTSDSSDSDNENETAPPNSMQTKAPHSLASQPARGILKSPPLSVSQDQNGYKRFSFSGVKNKQSAEDQAANPPAQGINIAAKFGEFNDETAVDNSIEDKSLKSPGAKGTSVTFKSDIPNPLAVFNSPELEETIASPALGRHRNSININGNGATTNGSGGNSAVESKRRKSLKGAHHHANPRGSIYYQALASDSINEVHPERIPDFIQRNFKNIYEESSKRVFQYTLFKLSNEEKPAISVSDLKLRFENNSLPYYEPKANQDVPIGEIIRETDRCTEIAALQIKFGGPGRAKFSPTTKYSPDSIKLRSKTEFNYESHNGNEHGAQTKRSIGFRHSGGGGGNISNSKIDSSEKASGKGSGRMGMLRTRSNNDCLVSSQQQSAHMLSPSTPSSTTNMKSPPQGVRPRSYSHELILDSNSYFGSDIITHGAAAAARLSLRDQENLPYFSEETNTKGLQIEKALQLVDSSRQYSDNGSSNISKADDEQDSKISNSSNTKPLTTRRHSISNPIREIVQHFEEKRNVLNNDFKNEHLHIGSVSNIDISSPTNGLDFVLSDKVDANKLPDSILFSQSEIMGLRLMFSLFDRSGSCTIGYEDLVAYAEETGDIMAIRDAATALEILDIDGDGKIGLLDFIHFARRLKKIHQGTR